MCLTVLLQLRDKRWLQRVRVGSRVQWLSCKASSSSSKAEAEDTKYNTTNNSSNSKRLFIKEQDKLVRLVLVVVV